MKLDKCVDIETRLTKRESELIKLDERSTRAAKNALILVVTLLAATLINSVSRYLGNYGAASILICIGVSIALLVITCLYTYNNIRLNKLLAEQVGDYRDLLGIGEEYEVEVDTKECWYRISKTMRIKKSDLPQGITDDNITDYVKTLSEFPNHWRHAYTDDLLQLILCFPTNDDTLWVHTTIIKSFRASSPS